jgi:uncharacterized membrane protein YgcG
MSYHKTSLLTMLALSTTLGACGLVVPDIKEPWDADLTAPDGSKIPGAAQIEFEIKKRVFCELKQAVKRVNQYPVIETDEAGRTIAIRKPVPLDWGAQLALSLEVDETTALNPGLSLLSTYPNVISYPARTTPLGALMATTTSQSYNFGLGATLSSTASRTDTFNPYYSVKFLMKRDTSNDVCLPQNDPFYANSQTPAASSPFILESSLGIEDWLKGATFTNNFLPSAGAPKNSGGGGGKSGGSSGGGASSGSGSGGGSGGGMGGNSGGGSAKTPDTITYEIKFVIVSSGNATPTWKLVRVSANTGNLPFFATGRTRTHDLIITIGPKSTATDNTFLAKQIGSAVSGGTRPTLTTP